MNGPRIVWEGKPTLSYVARVVVTPDEEEPGRSILVVEELVTDAMGQPSWRPCPESRREAVLEAALFALATGGAAYAAR